MRGIILAAGRGRRLESVFPGKPKCLIEFGGRSLLRRQIDVLTEVGVSDIVVVVGYEQQQVRDHLRGLPYGITYIVNPLYDTTNTLYSLWLAREYVCDDFVYFNADVLFDPRIVRRLLEAGPTSNLACVKGACGEEEVKVVVQDGRITEIGKHIASPTAYGEFIGIGLFRTADNRRFREILETCAANRTNWGKFFEHAVNILAPDTHLRAVDIADLPATEIDFPQDLEYAWACVYPRMAQAEQPV